MRFGSMTLRLSSRLRDPTTAETRRLSKRVEPDLATNAPGVGLRCSRCRTLFLVSPSSVAVSTNAARSQRSCSLRQVIGQFRRETRCVVSGLAHRLRGAFERERPSMFEDRSMSDATKLPRPESQGRRVRFLGRAAGPFFRLLPALLPTHRGQYVAGRDGSVIAGGPDQVEVAQQAYAKVGYVPVYVGLVSDEPPRPVRFPCLGCSPAGGCDGSLRLQPANDSPASFVHVSLRPPLRGTCRGRSR